MSSTDHEAEALALFEQALDTPSFERRQWLIQRTNHNPELRAIALSLLENDSKADDLSLTGGGLRAAAYLDEHMPERIGNYRIERLVGRGGMGAVYLGARDIGDFEHRVAIKLVSQVERSERLSERLRSERRTLAGLQHPSIAQLFDGGETEDGTPYFVMEYVDGEQLSDYLRNTQTPSDQRLAIFRQICQAVEYAHQQLVVHRDLAPSNILVMGDGNAKLIDFGISHTLGAPNVGNAPRLTATRGFAAPERLLGEPANTLSDVYSLGALLQEILTAVPAQPDPDLEAIANKAAADNPDLRYPSVSALMEDLDRHELHEPVSAQPPTTGYRLRKFLRRRRVPVALGSFAVLAATAALIVMASLYTQAEHERQEADARFGEVRELANFMLFDLYDEIAKLPGTTTAREMLAKTARNYLEALQTNPRSDLSLRVDTAAGFKRLADVLGNPAGPNLGRRDEAAKLYAQSETSLTAILEQHPANVSVLRVLANLTHQNSVHEFIANDDSDAAIVLAERSTAYAERLLTLSEPSTQDRTSWIASRSLHGVALVWLNRGAEGLDILAQAIAQADQWRLKFPDDLELTQAWASAILNQADTRVLHYDQVGGNYEDTLPQFQLAIDTYRQLQPALNTVNLQRMLMNALIKRAQVLHELALYQRELTDLEEALELANVMGALDPTDKGIVRRRNAIMKQRSLAYGTLGEHSKAITISEAVLAVAEGLSAEDPDNVGWIREVADAALMLAVARDQADDTRGACEPAALAEQRLLEVEAQMQLSDYYKTVMGPQIAAILKKC